MKQKRKINNSCECGEYKLGNKTKIIINNKWNSITNELLNANILAIKRNLYFEDFIIDSGTVIVIYETGPLPEEELNISKWLNNSKEFIKHLTAIFTKYHKIYLITSYPKSLNTIKYESVQRMQKIFIKYLMNLKYNENYNINIPIIKHFITFNLKKTLISSLVNYLQ